MSDFDSLGLFNYFELDGGALPPHQMEGIQFLWDHPKALLADDVGLGKTVQTAALLAALREQGLLGRCLVVVPAHLVAQWQSELSRWVPSLTVLAPSLQVSGRKKSKVCPPPANEANRDVDVLVISYETAHTQADQMAATGFRNVVLDEGSSVKGGGKEHAAVCRVTKQAERVIALTATPFENNLTETYAILRTLHLPDLWGPIEFNRRFIRWSEPWVDDYGRRVEPQPIGLVADQLPALRGYLSRHYLRRTAEEVGLALPVQVGEQLRWVPLTLAQQVALRAAQMSSTGLKRHHGREMACTVVDGRSTKAEAALAEILDRPAEAKFVVWAFHKAHLDVLQQLLDQHGIGWVRIDGNKTAAARAKALDAFRDDPAVRVLLGTDAFASGLNLQFARVMISLGSSYNPGKEAQREGRIRRLGSPTPPTSTSCCSTSVITSGGRPRPCFARRAMPQPYSDRPPGERAQLDSWPTAPASPPANARYTDARLTPSTRAMVPTSC